MYPLHMGAHVSITTCPSHVTLCAIYINTCLSSFIVHLPKAFGCTGVDNRISVLPNSLCVLFPSAFFRAELLPSLKNLVLCVQLSSSYRFYPRSLLRFWMCSTFLQLQVLVLTKRFCCRTVSEVVSTRPFSCKSLLPFLFHPWHLLINMIPTW